MGTVRELTIRPGLTPRPLVAVSVHNDNTGELVRLCRAHKRLLERMRLIAAQDTAGVLRDELDALVESVSREAGDIQLAARVLEGDVAGAVVLRAAASGREPATDALLEVCDAHDVLLATNAASAAMLVLHLARAADGAVRISHPSVFSDGRFPWDPDRLHRPRGADPNRRAR
ncbi:MAG: hypothetical protein ACXVQS_12480 [Actinomycetota bacterium]